MAHLTPPQVVGFTKRAEEDYEGFWEDAAIAAMDDIYWFKEWDTVLDWDYPTFKWYTGGLTNMCYSCVDYKVEQGLGMKAAFIAEDGDTGVIRTITYSQLLEMVKNASRSFQCPLVCSTKRGSLKPKPTRIRVPRSSSMRRCSKASPEEAKNTWV